MLPQAFTDRMKDMLGDEYDEFIKSYDEPKKQALRLNPLKGEGGRFLELCPFVLTRVPWTEDGYYYEESDRPGKHPYHEAGVYYIQEASAMVPVTFLEAKPGERILDLCAAPGGKSTQIAAAMKGQGILVCNEIHPARAKILSENVERMGVSNAIVVSHTPDELAEHFPGYFDRILVDAPCSGEGMFRKNEDACTEWSPENVLMCGERQDEILDAAADMLCPGGRLVYSTCTFAPEENEQVVAAFLTNHPEFTALEITAPWFAAGENGTFRMWPHKLLGEGHFAAVLQKTAGEEGSPAMEQPQKLPRQWLDFAKTLQITLPAGKAVLFGTSLYWAPEDMPSLRGIKVMRPGLELGEVKKDRFEPAHALALWLKTAANTADFSAESNEMKAYMHGQTLPASKKGWCLVMADGYSIGWGKGDGNTLKNHYPKGLRR